MDEQRFEELQNQARAAQALFATPHRRRLRAMLAGDHWLKGDGWVGPMLSLGDPEYATAMARLEKVFVSQNLLKELAVRHASSVAGREPDWGWGYAERQSDQLADAEIQRLADLEARLTRWWDHKRVWPQLQKAVLNLVAFDRGVVRLVIPEGAVTVRDDGTRTLSGSFIEVLNALEVRSADPFAAGNLTDDDGIVVGSYFTAKRSKTSVRELQALERTEDGSVLTTVSVGESGQSTQQASYELGGRLLQFEMSRDPLLTPQVVSLQMTINKLHTMASLNSDTAGFTERWLLNAQPPTREETYVDENGDTQLRRVRTPLRVGPGFTGFAAPYAGEDPESDTRFIAADVKWREPSSMKNLIEAREDLQRTAYGETYQLHALLSGDAAASGRSRQQAVNDFLASLGETRQQLEDCVRWLLSTALALASYLSEDDEDFFDLVPYCTASLTAVQPDAEDVRTMSELAERGQLSLETLLAYTGRVNDPDQELSRLEAQIPLRKRLMSPDKARESIARMHDSGVYSQREALLAEGYAETDAERIVRERLEETANLESGVVSPAPNTR